MTAGPTTTPRRCSETGLTLVLSPEESKYRIAKTAYGARNPVRRNTSMPRLEWGRWDAMNHSTIYAADSYEVAFAEVLADLRPKPAATPLWTCFDDVDGRDRATLEEQVEAEAPGMPTGQIARVWRQSRSKIVYTVYTISGPTTAARTFAS